MKPVEAIASQRLRVFLLWETNPEKVELYLLDDLSQEEHDQVVSCNGHLLGTVVDADDEERAQRILRDLSWLETYLEEQIPKVLPFTLSESYGTIVHSGFLL